jgi:hypothetical protein
VRIEEWKAYSSIRIRHAPARNPFNPPITLLIGEDAMADNIQKILVGFPMRNIACQIFFAVLAASR